MENKTITGFTLIELIVTIAILSIIVAIAIPAYESQKRKGYRSDAIIALQIKAQLQERWKTENGTYTADIADIGGSTTEQDKYTIAITAANVDAYTMTATAKGGQLDDTGCHVFTLSSTGLKSSTNSGAVTVTGANSTCWPR